MSANPTAKFSDRTRFNWGYHDARFEVTRGIPSRVGVFERTQIEGYWVNPLPTGDEAYCLGYVAARVMHESGQELSELSDEAASEFFGKEVAGGRLYRVPAGGFKR